MGCKSVLFFYMSLKLRFPDVEVNPGPRASLQCCRVMFTNINGLHGNRHELTIAATKFDVVACAETKVTGRRHVSELLLPGFKAPALLLRGARPNLGSSSHKCSGSMCCAFHGNVGRSDHASLGVVLNLSPTVAGFDVARRVPLKSRVNWNTVCETLSGLNWRSIFRSPTMDQDFDREVSRIMERFVPMVTVRR